MKPSDSYALSDRYTRDDGAVFLTGVQALARLPIEQLRADRRAGRATAAFISGYPGSPLGGYDKEIARASKLVPDLPIVHRPALNEEYAASAVMGSQLAMLQPDARYPGVLGIWYGKAPGVDRASDALRHAVFAGSDPNGGAVALVGDDPKAKSSTVPSSSAGTLADLHVPVLYPGDPGEVLDLGRHAITLSRITGLWTSLKIVADVADGSGSVVLAPERFQPVVPLIDGRPYEHVPDGRILTPHTLDLEREIYEVRYALAIEYASSNRLNHATVDPADAWIGIVSSGITYREVREALRRIGLESDAEIAAAGIRMLKLQMPLPFNPATIRDFARDLEEIFVIEEKRPNVESLVKDALYNEDRRPRIVGKQDVDGAKLIPGHGALGADDLIPALMRRLGTRLRDRLRPEQPVPDAAAPLAVARTPFYCSGCPHNRSTVVPEGSLVGAGIGCHTMALLVDPRRVGEIASLTCMGNEGTQWIGMAPFLARPHLFQNLGDGTFFHSGQLAIQATIAAGVSITYKLLWNGAVAMTGGQDPEGHIPLQEVARTLLAQGAARVLVTNPDGKRGHYPGLPRQVDVWSRDRLVEAQEILARTPGTTILIHDQECAAEARRARKRGLALTPSQRVVINARICEGCGDCGDVSNCLSVQPLETPFGRKTTIDQSTCNLDYSCLEGDCPSFMTIAPPGRLARAWRRLRGRPALGAHTPDAGAAAIPEAPDVGAPPDPSVPSDDFSVRITGIGGTGVVTVSQVLGTAAMFAGYEVRGLDQIGLSQKAGPVVSDLRLRRSGHAATNRLGRGQADLLLAFDQLVAASEQGLSTADPERTVVVGSTSAIPTGAMITRPEIAYPEQAALASRIAATTRPGHHWADAIGVTTALFGDAASANVFVVGMAVEAGSLPLPPDAIERAIELNGVAVAENREAFRWGRAQVRCPDRVSEAVARAEGERAAPPEAALPLAPTLERRMLALAGADAGLADTLRLQLSELVAYQDAALAGRFLDGVERVCEREQEVAPGSRVLTLAVARGSFKLRMVKDEYEVARLALDPAALAPARALADAQGGEISWRLHPPTLRALGLKHKLRLGPWAEPLLRLLLRLRPLRGTPLDPFGLGEVRRVERALPGEYDAAIDRVLADLRPARLARAVEIAELPDLVRGYEHIKLANVERFRARLAACLADYAGDPEPTSEAPPSAVNG